MSDKAELKKGEDAARAQVMPRGTARLEVEILPGVHATIEGKVVKPGDTVFIDAGCAVHLVVEGHGKIVGSE